MIIGITGTDGAGKGEVVKYLVGKRGFAHYHARTLLLEEIEKRNIESTRANMRLVANELRAKHGNDYIVCLFLERAKQTGDTDIVIDSLRAVAEADTLQAAGGVLLAVDADQALRYERVQKRRSESDQVSFEEFKHHEALESNDPDPHGMQKKAVIEKAEYVIQNDGSLSELHQKIDRVLEKIA